MEKDTKKIVEKQAKVITSFLYRHLDKNFRNAAFLKAGHYTIGPEGHRYRSMLGLEIYKLLGGKTKNFIKTLVGIEYIHHASLVFDDLPCMDNSKMRKRKRTTHLAFSESTAILAALYLWEKGRLLIYENATEHLKEKELGEFQRFISNNLIKIVFGQEVDLRANKSAKELITMMKNKNGMFYLACVIPSYLMGRKYLKEFNYLGKQISIAYQYFDDLRDLQPSRLTGKPKAQDKNKITSLSKYGEKEVLKKLENTKKSILNKISTIKGKKEVADLVEHILNHPL